MTNERLEFLGDSGAGRGRHRPRLPHLPRDARGLARQASRRHRQHERACRRRSVARPGRARCCWARARSRAAGATSPASSPMRSRRSSVPCTSTGASNVGPRADRAAVPPADGGIRPRRGRPGLQDDPAGARVADTPRHARVPVGRTGPDHEKEFTATVFLGGHRMGDRRRALEEGSRTAGGARGVHARSRSAKTSATPAEGTEDVELLRSK